MPGGKGNKALSALQGSGERWVGEWCLGRECAGCFGRVVWSDRRVPWKNRPVGTKPPWLSSRGGRTLRLCNVEPVSGLLHPFDDVTTVGTVAIYFARTAAWHG